MSQKFKFQIQKKFKADYFQLSDPELFENPKTNKAWKIRIPVVQNPYIDNEIRAYLQDRITVKKVTPGSAQKISNALCRIEGLLNTKYIDFNSITDISISQFTNSLSDFFDSNHLWNKNKTKDSSFVIPLSWVSWVHRKLDRNHSFCFEHDSWYIDDLPLKIQKGSYNCEAIYFSAISTPWLKEAVKKVTYFKLDKFSLSTCKQFVGTMHTFDDFLIQNNISSPDELTRDTIEEILFPYVRKKYPNPSSFNQFLTAVNQLAEISLMLGLTYFKKPVLFLLNDRMKKKAPDPRPYSDREIALIVNHMSELDDIYFDLTALLVLQGFRLSDIIAAKQITYDGSQALIKNEEDEVWIFTFYQYKTRKWTRTFLQNAAGEILFSRLQKSQAEYGENCKYIFAVNSEKHLDKETYRRQLRKMVLKNNIRGDDGCYLPIGKTHTFRKTVATDLLKMTHDPKLVAAVLGQKDLGSLMHYTKISETEQMEAMKNIHHENDILVSYMGKECPNILENSTFPTFENNEKLIPLSSGFCCKPGSDICNHANVCLFCSMFIPDFSYIPVYKNQLNEAKIARDSAILQGFDTIAEHNEQIIKQLEKIIQKLEGGLTCPEKVK